MADRITERRRYAVTARKFARIAELNGLQDAGGSDGRDASKAKGASHDTWIKRKSNNVVGFYKPQRKVAA